MDVKPETFFIGIINFFSVILPGAIVTSLGRGLAEPYLQLFGLDADSSDLEKGIAFIVASYVLGHFVFFIGSFLDEVYDRIRGATEFAQAERIKAGKYPPSAVSKWLARRFFKKNSDSAVQRVVQLKQSYVQDSDDSLVINAFQWCKCRLSIQCPGALLDVQRFEADSKFFRSLVVILGPLAVWQLIMFVWPKSNSADGSANLILAIICSLLSGLSFWRYIEQRFKATQQAYWNVITLERCPPQSTVSKS